MTPPALFPHRGLGRRASGTKSRLSVAWRVGSPVVLGTFPGRNPRVLPARTPLCCQRPAVFLPCRCCWRGEFSSWCVCLSPGGLFFWGATNTSRESTMYPKAVQDLCGWRIRSLACGYVAVSPGERDVCPLPVPFLGPEDTVGRAPLPLSPPVPQSGHQTHQGSGREGLFQAPGVGRS